MTLDDLTTLRDSLVFERNGWQEVLAAASNEAMRRRATEGIRHCHRHLALVQAEIFRRRRVRPRTLVPLR